MKVIYKTPFFDGECDSEECKWVKETLDESQILGSLDVDIDNGHKRSTYYNFTIPEYRLNDLSWLLMMHEDVEMDDRIYLIIEIEDIPSSKLTQVSADIIQCVAECNSSRMFEVYHRGETDNTIKCLLWISRATFMKFVGVGCDGDGDRVQD